MLKDLAWQMFKKTGNIEFFLHYKNLDRSGNKDFSTEQPPIRIWMVKNAVCQSPGNSCPGSQGWRLR